MASKAKTGGLGSLIREMGQDLRQEAGRDAKQGEANIFGILDYIEQPWGLYMDGGMDEKTGARRAALYPTQRFIVKLYYHLPLDDHLPEDPLKRIQVTDEFNTKVLYEFTEKDYLRYLFNEGRCNIGVQDHERRELVLAIGRRSGKTTLSGIFASYELYRILNLYNPQSYYGLPNGNRIQIISVATDKEQAGLLFNEVTSHLAKCDYFRPYIVNNTLGWVNLRTPYDIEKFGPTLRQQDGKFVSFNGKATLRVTFKSCNAKGLRGAGNVVVILDEVAHFIETGDSSAKKIYDAVTPSQAAFSRKDPNTGRPARNPTTGQEAPVESRCILISSPLGKSGKFYEKFELAMHGGEGSNNILAIQAPTWEVNPNVPTAYYREKYHEDPITFATEFGAQFSDQARGWIEREGDLMDCVDPGLRPLAQARARMPHQMGIDVGLVDDGTSVAITHVDGNRIVLDYHEIWYAGVDWRTSNPHLGEEYPTEYARTLANTDRLDFDEIAHWIQALCKRFHITAGLFDRWNGIPLEQTLHKKGLKQFKAEFFTRDQTSKLFQSAKMFLYDKSLLLYDWPIPERAEQGQTRHSPLIAELLSLQARQISKNLVLVEAPMKRGAHDDMSDALIRAIWLSTEALMNQKHAARSPGVYQPRAATAMTAQRYQAIRARRHGIGDRPTRFRNIRAR